VLFRSLEQHEKAIEDCTKAIELNPDDYETYALRGTCYFNLKQYEHAVEDYTKAIELAPDDSLYYGTLYNNRGTCYFELKQYEQAIEDYSKSIELAPDDSSAYSSRASSYSELKQYEQAIDDYTKAIELDPDNYSYRILSNSCIIAQHGSVEEYLKAMELAGNYQFVNMVRGMRSYSSKQYELALDYFTKVIELAPDEYQAYSSRVNCNVLLGRWDNIYEDLKLIKNNWNSFINKQMPFFENAVEYGSIKKEQLVEYKSPVHTLYGIMTKLNHEWMLKVLQLFFDLDKFSFFTDEFYELARLIDNLDNDISDYPQDLKDLMIKLLDMSGEYDEKEHESERQFYFKINIIKAIIQKVSYENDSKDLSKEEYKHYSEMQNLFTNILLGIVGLMTKKIRDAEEEKAKAIIEAQIKERNEVIAKLSHSIKNLIRSAVIDPLSYMQSSNTLNEKNLSDALKGANLIREIANGINLSLKGSFDDFVHDVQNSSNDGYIVKDMFYDCFKFAVSNMLDGKYFNVFMREYFNEREKYQTALSEWDKISQTNTSADILNFIKLNMLDIDFNFKLDEQLAIGNEKGSAIKLLILFQEIIFNAVKYSSFVNRDNRNMFISIHEEDDNIVLLVENNLNPEIQAKSSGLGSVIIDNFAKLLSGKLDIDKTNDRFKLKLTFPNIWNRKGE
ncbi:MAG: tetratricopeptide repeat protein, partial [Candidatus Cloacimonetes bacterium]|nr:tetratricopeptide repeat protein [Candidatus Cloacimonadota bacterium]